MAKPDETSVLLVLDTNVLLESLSFLRLLSDNVDALMHKNITMLIPYIVLQELDRLKALSQFSFEW